MGKDSINHSINLSIITSSRAWQCKQTSVCHFQGTTCVAEPSIDLFNSITIQLDITDIIDITTVMLRKTRNWLVAPPAAHLWTYGCNEVLVARRDFSHIYMSWVWWKWEILHLGQDSNPHLWHSGPVCYHFTTQASLMSPLYLSMCAYLSMWLFASEVSADY